MLEKKILSEIICNKNYVNDINFCHTVNVHISREQILEEAF